MWRLAIPNRCRPQRAYQRRCPRKSPPSLLGQWTALLALQPAATEMWCGLSPRRMGAMVTANSLRRERAGLAVRYHTLIRQHESQDKSGLLHRSACGTLRSGAGGRCGAVTVVKLLKYLHYLKEKWTHGGSRSVLPLHGSNWEEPLSPLSCREGGGGPQRIGKAANDLPLHIVRGYDLLKSTPQRGQCADDAR